MSNKSPDSAAQPVTQINSCPECVIGVVNRTDAEDCGACCEHELCAYHEGMDVGFGLAIKEAKHAWGI